MEFKSFSNGVRVPAIGFGTWHMGGDWDAPSRANDKKEIQAIRTAIELGMTHIDTAEGYGGGHAEELVAKAIEGFDRDELFITTKVSGSNVKYDHIMEACRKSMRRLGTYIDLYLIHWPDHRVPMNETMKAMDFLVSEGLVRHIGVSNFGVPDIKEAQKHAENKIICNQIEYNLITRNSGEYTKNMEKEIIPYCQKNGIMITAYRPVAFGKVANLKHGLLDELCSKYGKTRVQIAVNWLISKDWIITIPKSSNVGHIRELLGSAGWSMDSKDTNALDRAFQ